jgi:ADP-heptose:LPS heptosyltransferase
LKILAIQFRYLGDAVLLTPALRAIKEHFPDCSLHVLLAEEVAPLLQHLPWLDRVWPFPRRRGSANLPRSWPMFRALRNERFDCSVDFVGSDRGALVSLLCGARQRLAPRRPRGFFGRRLCYTQTVQTRPAQHQAQSNFGVLSVWGISPPACPTLEIRADPARAARAEELLADQAVLCHIGTSQPKKEWPLRYWVEFHRQAAALGQPLAYCAGAGSREQSLLADFTKQAAGATTLPALPDLGDFLAVQSRARIFISGDTGPMHFAAALGVPTISLFGASSLQQWAPLGPKHRALQAVGCGCGGDTAVCLNTSHCMAKISPEQVFWTLRELLNKAD